MYHRIIDPEALNYPIQAGMYVRPETFQMQMEYLARDANVIGLETLIEHLEQGARIPKKTIVITFDDGWLDNYTFALPILDQVQLPATVFLATSYINTSEWFWSDTLALVIKVLRNEAKRKESISARIFENDAISVTSASSLVDVIAQDSEGDLSSVVDTAIELLKLRPAKERSSVIKTLVHLAKDFTSLVQDRVFLNWDEIAEMKEANITFGSHTHSHKALDSLEDAQIRDELDNATQLLRAHIETPSSVFCYPGGYNSELSQKVLAQKGIKYALGVGRETLSETKPIILGRTGIHQDISSSESLFASRIWGNKF